MPQSLHDIAAILERTPSALNILLRNLPDTWTQRNEGPDTWTPKQIVAHYIHTDRHNWLPRIQLILDAATPPSFASMSRVPDSEDPNNKSLPELLDIFTLLRRRNLTTLRARDLQPAALERTAIHPAFGEVTLGNLLATWAAHDLTHLHQLSRTLAHQLREDVGPWTAYLGVMHCTAHSI
ncbi:DinB family protein [Granulicella sp. 5B5]|uniref:DinB family protein n=1 Tax=Granulicella sp. 5B5 TaxID=1617967 RepID=UPI0015F5E7DC|nr:DinB family protein [Granulicella sp. 5B5]QMV17856.1 DinB family protein [Granulicella sp. 5B5]